MTPEFQTIATLLIVAIATTWLVWRANAKRKHPGCGGDCGAMSPDLKRLQARLKK